MELETASIQPPVGKEVPYSHVPIFPLWQNPARMDTLLQNDSLLNGLGVFGFPPIEPM